MYIPTIHDIPYLGAPSPHSPLTLPDPNTIKNLKMLHHLTVLKAVVNYFEIETNTTRKINFSLLETEMFFVVVSSSEATAGMLLLGRQAGRDRVDGQEVTKPETKLSSTDAAHAFHAYINKHSLRTLFPKLS